MRWYRWLVGWMGYVPVKLYEIQLNNQCKISETE